MGDVQSYLYYVGEIFLCGNCPRGNCLGGNYPGGNCMVGNWFGGNYLFPILWLETVCGILLMLDLEFTKMAFLTFEHHLYLNRPFFNILITLHDEAWVFFLKDSTSYF